jgi:hypothetical protein
LKQQDITQCNVAVQDTSKLKKNYSIRDDTINIFLINSKNNQNQGQKYLNTHGFKDTHQNHVTRS